MRYFPFKFCRWFFLAGVLAALPFVAHGQDAGKSLRFVGNNKLPPIVSLKNGKPVGIAVDLAYAIAEKAHLSVSVEAVDWADAQAQVLSGQADALLLFNPTTERRALYDFSDPLLASRFHFFRKSNRVDIQDLTSLYGKRVGVESAGFPIQYLKGYEQIEIVVIPDWKTGFEMLDAEKIDAVFIDRWVGEYQLSVNRINGITVVEPPIVTDYSRIAVRKGNQALLDRINEGLKLIEHDGTRERILKKWQSQEVIYITRESADRLIVLAGIGVIILLISIALRAVAHSRAIKKINVDLVARTEALANEIEVRKRGELELKEAHDTLERRVVERTQALAERESLVRQIMDTASVGIILVDDQYRIAHANRRMAEMFRYSLEELSGREYVELVTPQDREVARKNMLALLDGHIDFVDLDRHFWRKDQTEFWGHLAGRRFCDAEGKDIGMIGVISDITGRKLAEKALLDSELFAKSTLDAVSEHLCVLDRDGKIIATNQPWREFYDRNHGTPSLGYGIGENYLSLCDSVMGLSAEDAAQMAGGIRRVVGKETDSFSMEYSCHGQSGPQWFEIRVTPFHGESDNIVVAHENITARKLTEVRLQMVANVFSHAREGITITDPNGNIIDVNETFTRITGYRRDEVIGKNPRIFKSGRHGAEFYEAMWREIRNVGYWSGEIWNLRKSGEVYPELLTISSVLDAEGKTQNYVALFSDITPLKKHQEQLENLAHYDKLTGLPNRTLKDERLRQAMRQCQRRKKLLAVAYLDLDGFKAVNDKYGHEVGDQLLITVSKRMQEALREGDTLARIGGDEFVAILVDFDTPQDCSPVLERILAAASKPVAVDQAVLSVSASIGVTLYPLDNVEAEILVRHADQAMYQAKQSGRNRFQLFEPPAE